MKNIFECRIQIMDLPVPKRLFLAAILGILLVAGLWFIYVYPLWSSPYTPCTCTHIVAAAAQKYSIGTQNQTHGITITYLGGQDEKILTGIMISVNGVNQSATPNPVPGSYVAFAGTSEKDHVIITSYFGKFGPQVCFDNDLDNELWIRKTGNDTVVTSLGSYWTGRLLNYSVFINNGQYPVSLNLSYGSSVTLHGNPGRDHIVIKPDYPRSWNFTSVLVDAWVGED